MILDGLRGLVRAAPMEIVLVWGCGPSISEAEWDEAALGSPDSFEKQTHGERSGCLVRKAIMVRPARAPERRDPWFASMKPQPDPVDQLPSFVTFSCDLEGSRKI